MPTRRTLLKTATAAATTMILPFRARADGHTGDTFQTPVGDVTIYPVSHASLVIQTPQAIIHVDPVDGTEAYSFIQNPDMVLITHEHGDHFDLPTLRPLVETGPLVITNPAVSARMPDDVDHMSLANGDSHSLNGITVDAIPAYNTTEGRLQFHPQGRDNGYVIDLGGFRIYISGDTEDIPEMRALEGIDIAFVCMNLPFTMDAVAAQDAIRDFAPRYIYPYHYRGRDNGTQDPNEVSEMLADFPATEVRFGDWYG